MPPNEEADLLEAHAARDAKTLVRLYAGRGYTLEKQGDLDAACFYLTHAYIWALEAGFPEAADLHARLKSYGREA